MGSDASAELSLSYAVGLVDIPIKLLLQMDRCYYYLRTDRPSPDDFHRMRSYQRFFCPGRTLVRLNAAAEAKPTFVLICGFVNKTCHGQKVKILHLFYRRTSGWVCVVSGTTN
jgi:hypothetical protein